MSFNRLLITAVVIENRPVAHVAAQYGVSQSWLFELLARYKAEGEAAFEPRSRRPKTVPRTTPTEVVDLILELREKLAATGLDAANFVAASTDIDARVRQLIPILENNNSDSSSGGSRGENWR